jgi:hypothetical protein
MCRLRFALSLIGSILVAATTCPSHAALIATTGPDSIFPLDAEIVVAPPSIPGPFNETAAVSMEQSFQVLSDLALRRIFFASTTAGAAGQTVNLTIFSVANALAGTTPASPAAGDILLQDQLMIPAVSAGRIVQIDLASALELPANVGTAGYVLRLSGNSAVPWVRTGNTAGSTYALGTGYEDSVAKTPFPPGRDYVVAFSSVPEPTSLVLAAFAAGLAALTCRR